MLAMVGLDGKVSYAQPAPIEANRHILPRSILGETVLASQDLQRVGSLYHDWLEQRVELRVQLTAAEQALS